MPLRSFFLMEFDEAMRLGMNTAENTWGESFMLDGGTSYIGTFNAHEGAQVTAPGGYEQRVDGTMVASKEQFGTVQPYEGQRLTLGNRRYTVVEVHEDSAAWSLVLKGINE